MRYRGRGRSRFSRFVPTQKVDVALRLKVWDKKGTINLRVTDIFDTFRFDSEILGETFVESRFRKGQTRAVHLSLAYQFSQGENLKKRNRKVKNLSEPGAME